MKLTGEERVRFLLGAIPYYRETQYSGNYYDNDNLNDILDAVERADLTEKQRQTIELTLIEDRTRKEAAKVLNVKPQTVAEYELRAITKITEAYEKGKQIESD